MNPFKRPAAKILARGAVRLLKSNNVTKPLPSATKDTWRETWCRNHTASRHSSRLVGRNVASISLIPHEIRREINTYATTISSTSLISTNGIKPLWESRPSIHPQAATIIPYVEATMLGTWPFASESHRERFLAAGFARVACLGYPAALNDRIEFACRMIIFSVLVDDAIDHSSPASCSALVHSLSKLCTGDDAQPDVNDPYQVMAHELFNDMLACDRELALRLLREFAGALRVQADQKRTMIVGKTLEDYLDFREKDVGFGWLCALMLFVQNLHLPPHTHPTIYRIPAPHFGKIFSSVTATATLYYPAFLALINRIGANHFSLMNDIYSWPKELYAAQYPTHREGGAIVSAIPILARELDMGTESARRVASAMCEELETRLAELLHVAREAEREGDGDGANVVEYILGLQKLLEGNKKWSAETKRYNF